MGTKMRKMKRTIMKAEIRHAVLLDLSERFPGVAAHLQDALGREPKRADYDPRVLEIYFDGICVLRQEEGVVVEQQFFAPDYRPSFIFIYGDSELLLVKGRDCLLLNLLPSEGCFSPWKTYEIG